MDRSREAVEKRTEARRADTGTKCYIHITSHQFIHLSMIRDRKLNTGNGSKMDKMEYMPL